MPQGQSFTIAHDALANVLITGCNVTAAFDPAAPPPQVIAAQFLAIWDTGATGSVITQPVIDALGLTAIGVTPVHGIHGQEIVETYLVNIALPNGVAYHGLKVTKGKLAQGGPAVLIGMDIIGSGDFAITNSQGKTVMTFRVPSCNRIDFVQEFHSEAHKERLQSLIKHRHSERKKKKRR